MRSGMEFYFVSFFLFRVRPQELYNVEAKVESLSCKGCNN